MNNNHIGVLDGLRGLAALLVVLTHATSRNLLDWYSTGTIGVAIFFCLSGFLMGFLYLGKEFSSVAVKRYAISRFSRIAPAYLTVIILSYFIFNFISNDFVYDINNHNLLRHIIFSGNVSVFWSIPLEVQFYVFFVLIWFAVNSYVFSQKRAPILLLIIVCSLMILFRNHFPGTFLASKLHFFFFGCVAGALRSKFNKISPSLTFVIAQLSIFFITLILGMYLVATHDYKYPYEIVYYAPLTAVMIFIMSFPTYPVNLMLANKPLSLIGKWSFSLYLTHEVVLQLVSYFYNAQAFNQSLAIVLAFGGSILLSWIMFELVEKTTQKWIRDKLSSIFLKETRVSDGN